MNRDFGRSFLRSERGSLPLVSVVTPAYNAGRYIAATLKSIMCQTYPNLEHVVIDDGSTDDTAAVLAKFEDDYDLRWFSKSNEGQAVTLNQAFQITRGEIVIWLNADDVLFYTGVVADVVEAFCARNVGVVYGHMAIIDENNRLLKIQYAPPKLNLDILSVGHFAACVFYRKNVISMYPLKQEFRNALDYEQCLRMAQGNVQFGFIDKPLMAWRKHRFAKSISGNARLRDETSMLRKKYGSDAKFRRQCLSLSCNAFLMARKLYGVNEVLRLYANPEHFHLAFDIRFDQFIKLAERQVMAYF